MATTCNLCSGPIVPPDTHLFCVTCMGLAHTEAALSDGMSCENCADLPMRALKARRDEARAAAGIGPTAATEPLVSPPNRRDREREAVSFPDATFRPPLEVANFVSFGANEEGDSMSLSASEKDWGSEHTRSEQENPMDLQDELLRILSMAVDELDLSWNAPDEPSKSKLDTWFLQSSLRQAASKRGTPFFPDVHDQVVKSWAAPQSARTLASTQAMFAPGEAVSALHAMAILQVMQAKLLKSMDGAASADAGVIRDLRSATDLALVATKRAAQAVGRSMGYLVVLHRHIWLTLSDVKDADRKTLLNAPITSTGLFGDAVDKVTERYSETQKKAKAMSHVIPRRAPPPQPRSRSSSATRRPQAPARQPSTPRTDPDRRGGRTSQWQGAGKRGAARAEKGGSQRRTRRLQSSRPDDPGKREREHQGGPPPKRRALTHTVPQCSSLSDACSVCVNVVACVQTKECSIKQIISSQKEPFLPLAPHTVSFALPSSSAESRFIIINPPRGREVSPPTHNPPAAPATSAAMTAGLEPRPLSHFLAAWEAIPGISPWVLNIIRHGYTLQFKRRPPRFRGVIPSLTLPQNAHILRQEVCSLLEKGVIEPVPPSERENGFYSRYFVVPKKGGGLRPILDLRPVNRALHKRAFKMTTLKQILTQVRPGDWFASVDLKDAYFHIQIVKRHRRFLRFAFEDAAYQYSVLPFGLALAPRTFSKCVDAALSPLRSSGMRILNYLDDWLILAHSKETLIGHVEGLLCHLKTLGMRVNVQKSVFTPSQTATFLGVCLDSVKMRARLSTERVEALRSSLGLFRPGEPVPLKVFQRLLGRMAAASSVCHLGLLHMRPLQLWLKARVPPGAWSSGHKRIMVTHSCIRALAPWRNPGLFSSGVPLGVVTRRTEVLTDASTSGWGAVCLGEPASGRWSEPERGWHINRLELKAVSLALEAFKPLLLQWHVLIRTDNTSVVSYINHQGGVHSRALFKQAESLLLWADRHFLSVRAAHIPGVLRICCRGTGFPKESGGFTQGRFS
ncbi:hypothetical protein PO909_003253 [Leuciscus waleckii]